MAMKKNEVPIHAIALISFKLMLSEVTKDYIFHDSSYINCAELADL